MQLYVRVKYSYIWDYVYLNGNCVEKAHKRNDNRAEHQVAFM